MTISELQPYVALALGAIGTILGIVNLIRDIRKNREVIEVSACPVVRHSVSDTWHEDVIMQVSKLEAPTTKNRYRNVGMWSTESLQRSLDGGVIPNLVGFEVTNLSSKSVFIDALGLADGRNRSKYRGPAFDAIQSLKAEGTESNGIEVKQNGKFTTYLFIDELAADKLVEGVIYPYVETTSNKRRVSAVSPPLESLAKWLQHGGKHV